MYLRLSSVIDPFTSFNFLLASDKDWMFSHNSDKSVFLSLGVSAEIRSCSPYRPLLTPLFFKNREVALVSLSKLDTRSFFIVDTSSNCWLSGVYNTLFSRISASFNCFEMLSSVCSSCVNWSVE